MLEEITARGSAPDASAQPVALWLRRWLGIEWSCCSREEAVNQLLVNEQRITGSSRVIDVLRSTAAMPGVRVEGNGSGPVKVFLELSFEGLS